MVTFCIRGGEVLVRAQEQPARGGTKLWRLPRLPDVPSGTQAPPPQFNCRPRHRRRQQQLNPLGSTPPSSQRLKWAPDLLQPLQRGDATHPLAAPPPSLKYPCHLRLSLFVSKTSKRKCASRRRGLSLHPHPAPRMYLRMPLRPPPPSYPPSTTAA